MAATLAWDFEEMDPVRAPMMGVLREARYFGCSQSSRGSPMPDGTGQHPAGRVGICRSEALNCRHPSHVNVLQNFGMHRPLN